jgi:hypothetical protein
MTVEEGLSPVNGVVVAPEVDAAVRRLDLFDQKSALIVEEDAVDAAGDLQTDRLNVMDEGRLRWTS